MRDMIRSNSTLYITRNVKKFFSKYRVNIIINLRATKTPSLARMNQSVAFEVGPVTTCCSCYRSEFLDDTIGAEGERELKGETDRRDA